VHTQSEDQSADKHHGQHLVQVKLNGDPHRIPAGDYTGAMLKQVLGIPLGHELELAKHHKLEPISNDEKIKIRGGEEFVSHCGQGQSS
jgi:hypothetical protein